MVGVATLPLVIHTAKHFAVCVTSQRVAMYDDAHKKCNILSRFCLIRLPIISSLCHSTCDKIMSSVILPFLASFSCL